MRLLLISCLLFVASMAQTADGVCECQGLPAGTTDEFPDYGNACSQHDRTDASPYYSICIDDNADLCGTANWCLLEWCYVDETDPDCIALGDLAQSSLYPGNWYSYQVCDMPDCYTCSVDDDVECPAECPYVPEGEDCDCPLLCVTNWIGDTVCDRREEGVNCYNCDTFWSGGAFEVGEFDGGDCELTTTSRDPIADVGDVVGFPLCPGAQGICDGLTLMASNVAPDMSGSGNNFGAVADDLHKLGWFFFQADGSGDWDIELHSEARSVFDFAVWGPFDDVTDAAGNCGTLTTPITTSPATIDTHTFTIPNAEDGKVYILMISDNNEFPGVITWNTFSAGGTPTTDCAILSTSTDVQCQSEAAITIDFENAEATRHNLGGIWAQEQNPPLSGEPRGIYYKQVGKFGTEQLGLLVTTTSNDYKCAYNHANNGNMCEQVITGPFGQVNMFTGDVDLKLQFRKDDPDCTGSQCEGTELAEGDVFPRIKLTVFDIDAGAGATPGGESVDIVNPVYVCPGGVVQPGSSPPYYHDLVDDNNNLDFSDNDFSSDNGFRWDFSTGCYQSRSDPATGTFTVKEKVACSDDDTQYNPTGKCKDNNPSGVNDLNPLQQSMAVEAEFHDVDREGITLVAKVSRSISTSRNFWFAGSSNSIGRTCCKDIFSLDDCPHGFINGNMECGTSSTSTGPCTIEHCCNTAPPTSFGDPIIYTFNGECYDLHQDGNWLASSHPDHDHDVHVAVYNEYMRQVSITDKATGEVLLAVNNYGEIVNNGWPYHLEKKVVTCPEDYEKDDCIGEYISISFDAQDLYYDIHAGMRHSYNDQALRDGEVGFHMDIWPQPFMKRFESRIAEYTGLYFHNPLPGQLRTCEERYYETGTL